MIVVDLGISISHCFWGALSHARYYILMISDIGPEYRFASVVAQRLKTLGALTKGDRRAAGGGDTSADGIDSFAIEGVHGRDTIEMMGASLLSMARGQKPTNNVVSEFMMDKSDGAEDGAISLEIAKKFATACVTPRSRRARFAAWSVLCALSHKRENDRRALVFQPSFWGGARASVTDLPLFHRHSRLHTDGQEALG
jgi:hypothetical protein